ncbi:MULTISPECIES: ABC transporter substrate-binding protein [Microbacterium]|uniref:ABC transporter substrate-binding protein n=1 Tax=Microbacterium TaxID=33882 RepID=UPI002780EFFF|nr:MULTISPECIES: ABC transporter substrate-binding protein [Microbacterium]MDQ1085109.1 peptide/nickel transport system substrate-binding protein [Microbacterium sp. SORGH_AS_0344]MDQ1169614.1 peptide/nickel transport system substrate-binding protein [Microbacterium proteolyticum]
MTQHPPRHRHRRRAALAAAVALSLTLLAGCAGTGAASGGADAGPTEGGDAVFLINSLGTSWVPNESSISSYQGNIWGQVTDKLVYVDDSGAVSPWVAESWEQNTDATSFTLRLKEGVTFSDGTPLDAAAVVTNLDYWAFGAPDKGITPIGLFPKTYQKATAVDEQTVEVTFSAPTLGFIPTLGYHGSILVSPKTLALSKEEQGDLDNFSGSGPFTIKSWADGDDVVLAKRDDYAWGPEAIGHTGAPYLDTLTYKQVAESSTRIGALTSDQAQVIYNIQPSELEGLTDRGFEVGLPRYLGFTNGYRVNVQAAPFDDVRVRQALQHGIDRQQILDTVYTDGWQAAQGLIQSNVPEATDHSGDFAFDADKAAALLDEAGWVAGADGKRTKNGQPLAVTLYANPYLATSASIDELVAQQLGALGFAVTVQTYDVATFGEKVKNDASTPLYEITRSFIDVGTVASILTSANKGENWFGLGETDPTLNDLRDRIARATDLDTRAAAVDELQTYVLQQGLFVPITQIVQRIYVQSPKLQGVTYNGVAIAGYAAAYLQK